MAVVLILILIAELMFSYGALRKLIDRQTASFFRLVQQEDDYDREMTREYTFYSLLKGIHHIASSNSYLEYESYFDIPDNSKNFRDLIHRYENKKDQAFQYEESLENGTVKFIPIKVKGDLSGLFFHKEIVFVS